MAKTLALGRPSTLGTLLFASVYLAMSKYVSDEPYHKVGGALSFVQMWLFAYFPNLSNKEPTSYKTLGLHVPHSLCTMPSNELMSFFLGLVDRALVHLFLRPNSVHISAWNHILASSQPYLHDFESLMASTSANCRELISRGYFAFSSSLSASPASLQPYLPCL